MILSLVGVIGIASSPSYAETKTCTGECIITIAANPTGHFIDWYAQNNYSIFGYDCNITIRDTANNALIHSVWIPDDAADGGRINGLYSTYSLRVSNSQCWGRLDNE